MHPRAYFDGNPYSSDKLGRRGGSATVPTKKDDSKPFKPSSPGKRVGFSVELISLLKKISVGFLLFTILACVHISNPQSLDLTFLSM